MDHSDANFIDLSSVENDFTIESDFNTNVKEAALSRSEDIMHNKEQQMHEAFYKKLADKIVKYDHVLLFGLGNAKKELHNHLKKDLHFKDLQIDVEAADKMTPNEKRAFVLKHFKV